MFLILFKELIFTYQSKEEAGSAGEQPPSNKIDAYTVIRSSHKKTAFFFYYRSAHGLKKLIRFIHAFDETTLF